MNDTERGLYHKYNVTKTEDESLVEECFVLRPDRDVAARAALRAYADACAGEYPALAFDLRHWLRDLTERDQS